jgi:serine/threonine protein kinase
VNGGYRPFDGDAWLDRELPLRGGPYRVLPESAFDVAAEMAFARQGRKARVFKLLGPDGAPSALKTFYRGFSLLEYALITKSLLAFGDIPGLRACQRRLVEQEEAEAIGEPGLTHAVLMPWIEGVAWAGVVEGRFPLAEATCLALAAQTAGVLAQIEARQLAHADVSSSNVLITYSDRGPVVELIDVEDMYHESLGSLPYVPDGSPGYAHPRNQGRGCRNRYGDRFAGAVLLTEMLAWHDPALRRLSVDVSVFEKLELCRSGPKFDLVRKVLRAHSAELATLFERTWDSPGLAGCPRLAEWATAMATVSPANGAPPTPLGPDDQPDSPLQMTQPDDLAPRCPGCRRPGVPRDPASHAPTCPLRPPAAATPVPDKSSFSGVPTHDHIGFIPLFPSSVDTVAGSR